MKNVLVYILVVFFFFSCTDRTKVETKTSVVDKNISDASFVVNKSFKRGDVRRYGVFPDSSIGNHPRLKKNKIQALLDLAESGLLITFPSGYYKTGLILKGRDNINFLFNDAAFAGQIQIIEDESGNSSNNINLRGKVTTFNKFFARKSHNISIDTLTIASNILKNDQNKRSLGCNIYAGTKYLDIKKLVVEDLGSGDAYYTYSLAALQIHGWNNNPEFITINDAIIEKSDRHGAYITGNNNFINKLIINKVGLGSINYNNGLEDTEMDEFKIISALWVNKSNNSKINNVIINCYNSKANYTVNFDEGRSSEPTVIDYLEIHNNETNKQMLPNRLTNVVVRHFKTVNE